MYWTAQPETMWLGPWGQHLHLKERKKQDAPRHGRFGGLGEEPRDVFLETLISAPPDSCLQGMAMCVSPKRQCELGAEHRTGVRTCSSSPSEALNSGQVTSPLWASVSLWENEQAVWFSVHWFSRARREITQQPCLPPPT